MAISNPAADGGALSEMNTTPLIDVMLVLLVMIIITVPVATHSTDMDLPRPCVENCPDIPFDQVKNKLVLTAEDELLWNGKPISERQLATLLYQTARITPEPQLHFEQDPAASYNASLRTLNQVRASGVTNFGFVGNERYRTFDAGT
ncbi:MAG: biopolymer transporter ExbD [Alteripontixanthobacter sp.]